MTLAAGRPWLYSMGLHVLGITVLVLILLPQMRSPPPAIRVRLSSPMASAGAEKASPAARPWNLPVGPSNPIQEPASPAWKATPPSTVPQSSPILAPGILDELLDGRAGRPAEPPQADPLTAETVWKSSGGEGYRPPPLPPPGLSPPQGAHWTLMVTVPGAGGYAFGIQGLDSGHPDLDRWLEAYLRTVAFPAGLDGQDYRVGWNLRLESGRPQ